MEFSNPKNPKKENIVKQCTVFEIVFEMKFNLIYRNNYRRSSICCSIQLAWITELYIKKFEDKDNKEMYFYTVT